MIFQFYLLSMLHFFETVQISAKKLSFLNLTLSQQPKVNGEKVAYRYP